MIKLKPRSKSGPARRILQWYDAHARDLPWRAKDDRTPDPYRVWLSEIMLQQTTVATVIPYFHKFLKRWPSVGALCKAPEDEVLAAWAGLGYYARARNLHKCAKTVAHDMGGRFPRTEQELRALPGVGEYTAAAIAAIAFGERATVVDGNIERVIARRFALRKPLPGVKGEIRALVAGITPVVRPGDFAQAMMDLGATICTPKRPVCGECPWGRDCEARARGIAEKLPARLAKARRPERNGVAFVAISKAGRVLLRKRPDKGLLGGMWEPPMSEWADPAPKSAPPFPARWRKCEALVRHVFTHFALELEVHVAQGCAETKGQGRWVAWEDLGDAALPTLMRKVLGVARQGIETKGI
jgi:A/G-specific adenine glycosylase